MPASQIVAARLDPVTVLNIFGTPVGSVLAFAGTSAPSGFVECDGSAISRNTYSGLFAAIGITHGNGDGLNTFNIPDCRGRTHFGKAPSGTFQTLGATGGTQTHNHTTTGHTHPLNNHTHSVASHSHSLDTAGNHGHTDHFALNQAGRFQSGITAHFNNAGSHNHGGSTGGTALSTSTMNSSAGSAVAPAADLQDHINPYAVVLYVIKT